MAYGWTPNSLTRSIGKAWREKGTGRGYKISGVAIGLAGFLELDGENIARLPLRERKTRLAVLFKNPPLGIAYSAHEGGDGEIFRRAACEHGLVEGIVSKRLDRPYLPGDRGAWVKTKCLNRAEFVSSDGRTQKDRGLMSALFCSVTSTRMDGLFTLAASARA